MLEEFPWLLITTQGVEDPTASSDCCCTRHTCDTYTYMQAKCSYTCNKVNKSKKIREIFHYTFVKRITLIEFPVCKSFFKVEPRSLKQLIRNRVYKYLRYIREY